jgi:hypothetical protein
VNEPGQARGDHASSRTDPDHAERLTGIYGSEGWGFESLRARLVKSPCLLAALQAVLQEIQANLTAIYTQIRDVAHYQGLLVALTYYALDYSDPVQVAGTQLLDSVIASVTKAFGGKVAHGFAAFQGPSAAFGGSPCAAGLLIKLPDGTCNIHPSPAGHLLLAKAIENVVGALPPK